MNTNKIYTAADFSRYHAGNMSAAEMHDIEKAALADPFLADALEGYALVEEPGNDLAGLRQKLEQKALRKKIFFLSPRADHGWLRIAAVFMVFAGIAFLFYKTNEPAQKTVLAKTEVNKPIPVNDVPDNRIQDSSLNEETAAVSSGNKTPAKHNKNLTGTVINTVTDTSRYYVASTATVSSKALLPAAPAAPSKIKIDPADEANATAKNNLDKNGKRDFAVKGNVAEVQRKSADVASVNISGNNNAATDQKKLFKSKTSEGTVTTLDGSTAYVKKEAPQINIENQIALDREKAAQEKNAMIVPEESNKQILKRGIEEKAPGLQRHGQMESIDSVVFIDYLAQNIKPRADSANKAFEGKVVLSFSVNKKGVPENIRVEKSLCKACDEQAIQLLKSGPHWIYAPNRRKQVTVEY